jgi:hypothetical protein
MTTKKVNIILDDDFQRITPNGFIRFYQGEDLIDFVRAHPDFQIEHITFDNDLGLNQLEGYQVFDIMLQENWPVNSVNIHSQNNVAANRMVKTYYSAQRHHLIDSKSPITCLDLKTFSKFF